MGLFGDLFDFNGDGVATPEEELLGLMMMDEMMEEEEKRHRDDLNDCFDDLDEDEGDSDEW